MPRCFNHLAQLALLFANRAATYIARFAVGFQRGTDASSIEAPAVNLQKLAYSIKELCDLTGLGRTRVFDAIHEKRLRAKKYGRLTLILMEDSEEFSKSLPDVDR